MPSDRPAAQHADDVTHGSKYVLWWLLLAFVAWVVVGAVSALVLL